MKKIIMFGILILILGVFLVNAIDIDNDQDGYNSAVDCNDLNTSVWQNITLYRDNDNDGNGAGNWIIICLGANIPINYSINSLDCNDSNTNIWQALIGYIDRDSDGFGDIVPVSFCSTTLPHGYAISGGDCDDVNPYKYPNAIELCNRVDDNCYGGIDENFPNKEQTCFVGLGECRNKGLMVCNKDMNATFCRGIAKRPAIEIYDGKDNDCDGLIDEESIYNITNTSLGIFSPAQEIFNKNNIQFNLSIISPQNIIANKISYIDYSQSKPKEILLCKNCNNYGLYFYRTVNLKDGIHNITFNAFVNQTILTNSISFIVDRKRPRISLSRIRTKDFVNGTFFINYDEINLKEITLFYENKSIVNNNCTPGNKQVCNINADLTQYSGKDILYRLQATDIAGNSDISNNMTAEVDITLPIIENITYPVIGNHVFFRLNITEKNFKDVSYYDNSENNPRWRILCSVLKNSICEKEQRLSPGEHNITIRVVDKAKNSVSIFV